MPLSATRQDLLTQLKGQCLEIPDLSLVFKHWPLDISPSLEEMRALVPSRIDRYVTMIKALVIVSMEVTEWRTA